MNTAVEFWPVWLAVTIAVLVGTNQLLTESEKFANLLGRFGRKVYDRARARSRMDTVEFSAAVRDAVKSERESWEAEETRAFAAVERDLAYVTGVTNRQQERLEEFEWSMRCLTAYTEYEADWHHRMRLAILKAEQNGGVIPVEDLEEKFPHMHYREFEEKCRTANNMNWRSWEQR